MRLDKYLLVDSHNQDRIEGKYHRSVPITEDEFIHLKDRYCFYPDKTPIYRGIRNYNGGAGYLSIDPAKHTRVSEYTSNLYMLLMELSPQWEKYPRFSKSIICTTSRSEANGWGKLFRVYPYDGAILGVTPKAHFWGSFPYMMDTLTDFMRDIFEIFNIDIDYLETNKNVFMKACKRVDVFNQKAKMARFMKLDDEYNPKEFRKAVYDIIEGKPTFDVMCDLLPSDKFKLTKAGSKIETGREVWTEGKCLLELLG